MQISSKVPLQGAELDEYLAKERAEKEKKAAKKAAEDRRQRILEADADDTDEEDDSDSDSEDENEVEFVLAGAEEDPDTVPKPPMNGKRKSGKRREKNEAGWSDIVDDDGLSKQMLSYDIYLKGNVAKATSFFKSADGQSQRFRMFPYIEKKRRIDDYGELIDVEVWMRKGKALEENTESDEMKELAKVKAEEEEKVEYSPWFGSELALTVL